MKVNQNLDVNNSDYETNEQVNRVGNNNFTGDFVPGHIIVGLKPNSFVPYSGLSNYLLPSMKVAKAELIFHPPKNMKFSTEEIGDIFLIELEEDNKQSVLDAIQLLEQHPAVDYAEPNYINHADDPMEQNEQQAAQLPFSSQNLLWNLERIGIPTAWNITRGNPSIKVGVIDSGVDNTHPNLSKNVNTSLGYDFVLNRPNATDVNGHGTHVAGTIGAVGQNSENVIGVSPEVEIIALRSLNENNRGQTADTIRAINQANNLGIDIINHSISGDFSQARENAIRAFNGLFVTSAGNDARDIDTYPIYPAASHIPNMITVGNSTQSDQLRFDSNFGRSSVDLFAPGTSIRSTRRGGGFETRSGTSMAAPHVAGAAVLALSLNPSLSPVELKDAILNTVDPVPALANLSVTGGRLNVDRLVNYVADSVEQQPQPPIIPTLDVPRNLRITGTTATSITIEWDAPTNPSKIMNYEVFRDGVKIGEVEINSPRIYVDMGLRPNINYSYTVRSHAISNPSNTVIGTVQGENVVVLQPPTNLRATSTTTNSISMDWNLPISLGNVRGYRIYRDNTMIDNVGPMITSYTDTGLLAGTTYTYRVASYDLTGKQAFSNNLSVSTSQTAPPTGQAIVYRVTGEGSNRQTLVISNRTSNRFPIGWGLQFNFSGTAPTTEWPANWARGQGNRLSTTGGVALNAGGSVSIPVAAGADTRIFDLIVNGTPAIRE